MTFALGLLAGAPTMEDLIRVLAIIGGGALGAFVTGFLTQAIVRGYTGQKVPRWVVWTLRVLGGVAMGWLVYLLVFSQGNSLFGGFGGGGTGKDGGGKDGPRATNPAVTAPKDAQPTDKDRDKDGSTATVDKGTVLRIEVLGDAPLQKLVDAGRIKSLEPERSYRLADDDPTKLLTLQDVEHLIKERLKRDPPLRRLELVLYKDSPQKQVPRVAELKKWADLLTGPGPDDKVIVDFKEPGEVAPVR
jgi:hypothetical protein